jgi:hypothetical protein
VRKATLSSPLTKTRAGIRISEHIEADGATVFRHACKLSCEDAILPIGGEQLCYVKEAGAWKIAGFYGGEASK